MSCSSVKLWKGTVVAGYGTGQIRLYEAVTGILHAEVNAHARWIYSLDIAPFSGLVSYINHNTVYIVGVYIAVVRNVLLSPGSSQ